MKWGMLWDISVHDMSLPFDRTCCPDKAELGTCLRFLVSRSRNQKLQSELFFLLPLPPHVQSDVVHQLLDLRHKPHTNSCEQHVLDLHVVVSLCSWDSSDSLLLLEFMLPKALHPHHFSFPTSSRGASIVSGSSPIGATSRPRIFVGLTSALPFHTRFPTAESCSHFLGFCGFQHSVQVEIENVVFEIHGNELVSSMPVHQFLRRSYDSLTIFAVNRDHVTAVMSQIEILSSLCTRSLQHYTTLCVHQ